MPRICLLALCGLPAAGKTTFSHRLIQLPDFDYNILHICFDNFLHFNTYTTEMAANTAYKAQRAAIFALLLQLITTLRANKSLPATFDSNKIAFKCKSYTKDFLIICDDNNYYRSMRYKLLQLCRQHALAFGQIYFNITLEQSLRWNTQRTGVQCLPAAVLHKMAARLEPPQCDSNTWEAHGRTLILTPPEIASDAVLSFVRARFEHIEQAVPVAQQLPMPMSKVHELDILLRRRVGHVLQQFKGECKPAKAASLNALRRQILRDFRSEKLCETDAAIDFDDYLNLLQ